MKKFLLYAITLTACFIVGFVLAAGFDRVEVKIHKMKALAANVPNSTITVTWSQTGTTAYNDGGWIQDGGLRNDGGYFSNNGSMNDGGYIVDAGVFNDGGYTLPYANQIPYYLLDGGTAVASSPVQTSQTTRSEFILEVQVPNGATATVLPQVQGANAGSNDWVNISSSLVYGNTTAFTAYDAGGVYTLDLPNLEYPQIRLLPNADGGSNGVLTGTVFLKGLGQ